MFHQIAKKIIALVTTVCLLVGMMVVPSAAADDTQMYLYNGVELPALPVWDRVVYPYAVLFETEATYYFYCFSEPQQATLSDGVSCYNAGLSFVLKDGLWVSWNALILASYATIWSNYDVYRDDGTLYMSASVPVFSIDDSLIYDDILVDNGPPAVETVPDSESIIEVLNSILEYDVATWNLLAYGTNRIRYIERYVASILEAITPSEEETALKESTKETTQAVNDSLFADDAPTKVTVDDVTDVAQVGSAAAQMFNPGVGVSAFFDAFNNINLVSLFTQASIDDMYAVDEATTFSLGKDDGVVDYYTENFNKIKEFVGSGD